MCPTNQGAEKAMLLDKLQAFSEFRSIDKAAYSDDERQHIHETLRNLGYVD